MATKLPTAATEKIRVLVTDDSRVMRKAISKILQDDAELIEAENGEQGWNKLLGNDDIQVIITDIEMPVLDGYQLICRIRAHEDPRINSVPIITITGAEDEETKTRAFACGATDFIVKPLDKVQLQARVQAHAKLDDTTRALAESEATLQEEAANDPLTGLASRKYFVQRGEQDIAHALRHKAPLSFMSIDIDNFKKLYQEHGDDGTDKILQGFAKLIQSAARKEDTVSRIGGADFGVIAPATDQEQATLLAERMRTMVNSHPIDLGAGTVITTTASIGVVSLGLDGQELEALLEKADHRVRDAKAEGGDHVCAAARDEAVTAVATEEVTLDATAAPNEAELSIAQPITTDSANDSQITKTGDIPADLIDIDRALEMLTNGQADKISPYLLELSMRVLPLLEHCDREQQLNISKAIDDIKERLYSRN
jgi:diguanylate cyclase (GGDEF)-like protein